MSVKLNKIELSVEFIVRRRGSLGDVMSTLYQDKNKKDKSFRSSHRRCSLTNLLLKVSQNSPENTCVKVS